MPVAVPGAGAHQHCTWADRVEELVEAVPAAVVGHLEHVGAQVDSGGQQVGLGRQLDVAGEQDRAGCGLGAHHERAVVDLRSVVRIDRRVGVARPDDVEHEPRPPQLLAGREGHQRRTGLVGLPLHLDQRLVRLANGPDRHPAHRPPAQRAGQAVRVVGVQVADQHQGDAPHAEPAQAGVHRAVLRSGVDQHHPAGPSGG